MAPAYDDFFKDLGFKRDTEQLQMRNKFMDILKIFSNTYDPKYTRASTEGFVPLTCQFLSIYGSTYFGKTMRDHLVEPSLKDGFLHPRDTADDPSK